jgi:DNA transposition AAA+ family ATPase
MTSATAVGAGSSFIETSEHRRFADFCDACRRYRYIGLCYGVPGVGKTLSARTYAEWALVEPLVFPGAAYVDTVPSAVGGCRTLFYTPPVVNSPARIAGELERLRNVLNWVLGVAQTEPGHAPAAAPTDQTELVVIDEADRLKMAGLEQVRDLYDQSPWGLVLLGLPGLERRLSRYPQLYSRVGFVQ